MNSLRLYVIVFISGGSVLALEILGTRILGPFYGVSLFLWSALITVTLAALSLGYAVGGHWADRGPSFTRLGIVLALAGAWVLLIPILKRPVLLASEPLGLRAAVLTAATLLFAPPLTLLGMVSPYAIRLKASELQWVGRTAGNLFAVSTLASVLSALAMGFFLIPSIGVTRLTYAIGLALLVASLLAFLYGKSRSRLGQAVVLVFLLLGAIAMRTTSSEKPDPEHGLVAVRQSPYADLRVVDFRHARHLLVDGAIHTTIDSGTKRSWHPYAAAVEVSKFLYETPGTMLLIGLGGGQIAKSFSDDGWQVDAVEIDRAIGEWARQYFGLESDDCRSISYMDGRRYLAQTERLYDLMILDAYGSSSIPFHLATVESFGLMARRLRGHGVLAINVEAHGWHDPLVASLARSLMPHFSQIQALPSMEPPSALGNVILLAANREITFDEYALLPRPFDYLGNAHEHWWMVQINHAWDSRYVPDTAGAQLLTDDLNPVDLMSERVSLEARRSLHGYFADFEKPW